MTALFLADGLLGFALWKMSKSFVLPLKCAVYVNPTQKNRKAIAKPIQQPEKMQSIEKGLWWGGGMEFWKAEVWSPPDPPVRSCPARLLPGLFC